MDLETVTQTEVSCDGKNKHLILMICVESRKNGTDESYFRAGIENRHVGGE